MDNPFDEIMKRLEHIENLIMSQAPVQSNQTINNGKPVTTKELCKFLNVTEPTIIRWRRKGKIPFYSVGSAIRFDLGKVIQSLEKKSK